MSGCCEPCALRPMLFLRNPEIHCQAIQVIADGGADALQHDDIHL